MPYQSHNISSEAAAICARLALGSALSLPPRLFEPSGNLTKLGEPTTEAIEEYLSNLLGHDPASFLERYGKHLREDELESFSGLCDDYEVSFWLRRLHEAAEQAAATPSGQASCHPHLQTVAKNRRLAAMQQLHAAGEYFAVEAMQSRDPLLYHQYIGQYNEEEGPGPERLSEALMRQHQQAQLRTKMEQLLEQEDEQLSEHDSDEEEAEGTEPACHSPAVDMEVSEPAAARPPPTLRGTAIRGIPAGGHKPMCGGGAAGGSREAEAGAGAGRQCGGGSPAFAGLASLGHVLQSQPRAAMAAAAAAAAAAAMEGVQQEPPSSSHADHVAPAPLSTQELEEKRRQFVEEMEARFLFGKDAAFVDYGHIDADSQLDDHWLVQRGRDAEDAYFDSDAEGDRPGPEAPGGALHPQASHGQQQQQQQQQQQDEVELEEWEKMAIQYASQV